ncbi:MAG TPA: S41 family peptidase [Saprospiraceae bacterium]|nr:S41 family peptidase [Saprospiraceae bacterium]HPN68098.1 S41 family peptidase [Saprospiraceae bacterium]
MKTNSPLLLIIIVVLFVFSHANAQNSSTLNGKMLTKNQIIEDYDILYSTLVNYHPVPFQYINEEDLKTFYNRQKSQFPESLTELEFNKLSRNLIAKIGCGHTSGKPSDEWFKAVTGQNVLLPFTVQKTDDDVYISGIVDEEFDFQINDKILAINHIPIEEILMQMAENQQRDGLTQSFVDKAIYASFRTYYLFLYGIQKEFHIDYKTKTGEINSTIVQPTNKKIIETKQQELTDNFYKIYEHKWSLFAYDSTNHLAYLKIKSFSDRNEYKDYYEKVFKWLAQQPQAKLIVDIRDNGGGFFKNGNKLLTYFTPNKFDFNMHRPKRKLEKNKYTKMNKSTKWTKVAFSLKPSKQRTKGVKTITFKFKPNKLNYKGDVHLLTNGNTFSQAALVASQLKEYGATIYGMETGGTEQGTNCMLNYQLVLPNSGLKITIPYYQVLSNSTKSEFGYGVKPNYEIKPAHFTLEDNVLNDVVKIISK